MTFSRARFVVVALAWCLAACGPDAWVGTYAGSETVTASDPSGGTASNTVAASWSIDVDSERYTIALPACTLGATPSGAQLALVVGTQCDFGDASSPLVLTLVSGAVSRTSSGIRIGTLWTLASGASATIELDGAVQ